MRRSFQFEVATGMMEDCGMPLYQHRWTADDQSLYDTWKFLYKVIVLANKSLDVINEKKDLLSVQQQQEYGAEVKAVRALFYYYAMDMFGLDSIDSFFFRTGFVRCAIGEVPAQYSLPFCL